MSELEVKETALSSKNDELEQKVNKLSENPSSSEKIESGEISEGVVDSVLVDVRKENTMWKALI